MALNVNKLFDVTGKVALITGGTGALGRIAALGLAQAGAKVVITASNKAGLEKVAAEVKAAGSRSFWGEPVESWTAGNLVGTPEQVCERVRAYIDLGCSGFIPWCSDYPDTESMELFATQVVPNFR